MATVREKVAALSLSTVCSPARPPGTAGHRQRDGQRERDGLMGALPAVGCGSPPEAAPLGAFPGSGSFKNWPRSGSRFRRGPVPAAPRSAGGSGSFGLGDPRSPGPALS